MIKQLIVLILIAGSVYLSGGFYGLVPFLNAEALLLVFGGTFLLTWAVYPVKEMFRPSGPAALLYAERCAIGMGVVASLLNIMVVMLTASDVANLLRGLACALAGLFYGFLLAKVIISPFAARLNVKA